MSDPLELWIAGVACLVATGTAAPMVRRWLVRQNIVDHPNHRSSHRDIVPRGGGFACLAGLTTGAAALLLMGQPLPWQGVAAVLFISAVGALDDRHGLPPLPRLLSQIITGALLGGSFGGINGAIFGAILAPLLVNVVNFVDGINGITALTMIIWGVTAATLGHIDDVVTLTSVGVLTAAAALGFLPWNVPRARLFLGDVGSYMFGILVSVGTTIGVASGVSAYVLLAPLSISIFDVLLTLARRAIAGSPLLEAHREHIYQQILQVTAWSHFAVALLAAALSAVIVAVSFFDETVAVAVAVVVFGIYAITPWHLERHRQPNSLPSIEREAE